MNDQAQKLRELSRVAGTTGFLLPAKDDRSLSDRNPIRCRSIAVTSGKGGVGKTNISLFLALALASVTKKRVLVLDADLGLANMHIVLGLAPKRTISHVVNGECTLSDIIANGPNGVDIIPGASGLEELANIDTARLTLLRNQFMNIDEHYDYMIIDTGAGISAPVTQFASHADLALLVMTPEPTSLADAYAMVKILSEKGTARLGVVVNMATSDKDGIESFDRLNALVIKFLKRKLESLGSLPFDREVGKYVRRQRVYTIDNPHSQIALLALSIARRISGLQQGDKQGFFARFFNRKVTDVTSRTSGL